jgi:Caspase domain
LPSDASVLDNNVRNVSATTDGPIICEEDPDKQLVPLAKASLIAACRFSEYSWEDQSLGHGLMTQSFLDIITSSNFQITYDDLLSQLRTKVGDYINRKIAPGRPGTTQVPQLRGQQNRMSEEFLAAWSASQ